MSRERSLVILFLLVAGVFFLRRPHSSITRSFASFPRHLQQNTTENATINTTSTLGAEVVQKICSTYVYSPSTLDEQQSADDVSETITTYRDQGTLKDLILQDKIQSDLITSYVQKLVPFLVALGAPLAVTLIAFTLCLMNWCCMCCPCCSSMRCGLCDRPRTKGSINIYALVSLGFCLLVLGSAIGGISVFTDISGKVEGTMCQGTYMLGELHDGIPNQKWFGIEPLKDLIGYLADSIWGTRTFFKEISQVFTTIGDKAEEIRTDLKNLETGFTNRTLPRAYFVEEETYIPQFTQTLGEHMSTAYDGVTTFEDALSSVQGNFDSAVNEFGGQRVTVVNILDQGRNQAANMEKDLRNSLNWLGDNGDTVLRYSSNFNKGLRIALGIFIGLAGFALISIIGGFWSKYKQFNKCLHLSWFLIGLFMVITWISATILFPLTVACVEACQVVDGFLNNETFANQTLNSFFGVQQSTLKDSIVLCLHGSGEIIDQFNIKNNLGLISTINNELDNATGLIDNENIPTSINISSLTDHLNSIDANSQLDDAKTLIDLNYLTQLSHQNLDGTQCAAVADAWVLSDLNCAALGINSILDSQEPDDFDVGQPFCIPIARWMDPAGRNIQTRYTPAMYQNCAPVTLPNRTSYTRQDFLDRMVNRFVDNRKGLAVIIQDITNGVDQVNTKANNLLSDARTSLKAPFTQVLDFLKQIQATVFDEKTGLIYNTQCSFVETRIRSLHDELCVSLIPTVYHTAIAMIIGAIMASLLTLSLFFLMRKLMSKQDHYDDGRRTFPQNNNYNMRTKGV